ncbi:DUF4864 domain-containing protein [Fodinicurvata sp. EGI_FJ10296]|uniref:DUF4864 domain-containing protein n=1 Tax=Fodinicurvata sp. EGI_FJ10296 TaxID=3231908 RepID=UPI0034570FE5
MRKHFAALVLVCGLSLPAYAHADEVAIASVITGQIAAFQADDFDAAFEFASPMIKRQFGTPQRFGRMVQSGYPMVYRPAEVTMLDQHMTPHGIAQHVMVRDAEGELHFLGYLMIETDAGWQINAVYPLPGRESGA